MFNLVKYRYLFLIFSLLIIVPGTISLIFKGLNVGIDFASGSDVELRPQKTITALDLSKQLKQFNLKDLHIILGDDTHLDAKKTVWVRLSARIDPAGDVANTIKTNLTNKYPGANVVFTDISSVSVPFTLVTVTNFTNVPQTSDIQTLLGKLSTSPTSTATGTPTATATVQPTATPKATATAQPTAATTPVVSSGIPVTVVSIAQGTTTQTIGIRTSTTITTKEIANMLGAILNNGGPYMQLLSNSEVGPSVAGETTRNAILAVLAASLFILLYVWFSFRKVAKAWRYGTCAIIAMLHDVFVVLGVFSILGWLLNIQIDALFITALLTVVGFSVHDTIVVFDRIRENMQRRTSETFEQIVNASLVQTMARSLNTSLTVLFTLLALTLFSGGGSVGNFTLTLLIGIFSGTYSSIFNASMLLVIWEKGELGLSYFSRDQASERGERRVRELARS